MAKGYRRITAKGSAVERRSFEETSALPHGKGTERSLCLLLVFLHRKQLVRRPQSRKLQLPRLILYELLKLPRFCLIWYGDGLVCDVFAHTRQGGGKTIPGLHIAQSVCHSAVSRSFPRRPSPVQGDPSVLKGNGPALEQLQVSLLSAGAVTLRFSSLSSVAFFSSSSLSSFAMSLSIKTLNCSYDLAAKLLFASEFGCRQGTRGNCPWRGSRRKWFCGVQPAHAKDLQPANAAL